MSTTESKPILPTTNEDTVGPYFPIPFTDYFADDLSIVHPGLVCKPSGQPIILKGRILDKYGNLANGVLLEFWQANSNGVYRNPNSDNNELLDPYFFGFSRIRTGDGRFKLKTIKPGPWKNNTIKRAPNITLTIFSDGLNRLVTQIFFDDEESNESDVLLMSLKNKELSQRLIAKYQGNNEDGTKIYEIDIILSGNGELPFFDDLLS